MCSKEEEACIAAMSVTKITSETDTLMAATTDTKAPIVKKDTASEVSQEKTVLSKSSKGCKKKKIKKVGTLSEGEPVSKKRKAMEKREKVEKEDSSDDDILTDSKEGETSATSSKSKKDVFMKPKQVRKQGKVRRNSLRQNKLKNLRTKFQRKWPSGKIFKRRKKELGVIVPPTIFLLGGNINDPLNLNSLQDEELNRAMNAVTPKSSPLPTPQHRKGEIEVILPRNIKDPLHLTTAADDVEYLKMLSKKNRKRRKRKRGNSSSGSGKEESFEAVIPVEEPASAVEGACIPPDTTGTPVKREALCLSVKEIPKRRKGEGLDKIVSPVVPQPGAWKRGQPKPSARKRKPAQTPKFNPRNERYQYGNYDRYYGYRNPNNEGDLRLESFMQHPELFVDKDVLDIGCNIGHITLSIARNLGARSVVGLDIDKRLIGIARKNVQHYVHVAQTPAYSNCPSSRIPTPHTPATQQSPYQTMGSPVPLARSDDPLPSNSKSSNATYFPISMPVMFGPLELPGLSTQDDVLPPKPFPHNVNFVQGSYVLESDALLMTESPQFDTILCLSVTKWMHLNWGDAGLKRAFRRMYAQLRPGGKLILEAQAWPSYNRKKCLTEQIYRNYMSIELMPDKFIEYLLSSQVGFTSVEEIGRPKHRSAGFRRAIQVLTKPGLTPSSCNTPVCYTPYSQRTCVRRPVYTSLGTETYDNEEEKKTKDS